MSQDGGKFSIIPTSPRHLLQVGSSLIRRGLDDLSKSQSEKGRVLLVDDEPRITEITEQILLAAGYAARIANDALTALTLAETFQPQVAMLGAVMPVLDGFQLGMQLSAFLSRTKIVIWVEVNGSEDLTNLLRQGYSFGLFPVPFEKDDLILRMQTWMLEAATFDSATGFWLARHFIFVVDSEIYRSIRYDYEFSIIFFDVVENWESEKNDLSFNNRRQFLGEFAYRVASLFRIIDLCFRYSEGEFAILLPQTVKDQAEQFSDKLSTLIHETKWEEILGRPLQVSARFAVVSFPQDGRTRSELIASADSLLRES